MVKDNTEDMPQEVVAALRTKGIKTEPVDPGILAQLLGSEEISGVIVSSRKSLTITKDAVFAAVSDKLFAMLMDRGMPPSLTMMLTRPLMALDHWPPAELLETASVSQMFTSFRRVVSTVIVQICENALNDTFDHDRGYLLLIEANLLTSITVDGYRILPYLEWEKDAGDAEEHAPVEGYDYFTHLVSPQVLQDHGWDFCPHPGVNKPAFMAMLAESLLRDLFPFVTQQPV